MHLLFVCTHNRCRSIIAEAVTRDMAGSFLTVASAGSSPVGEVHPLTLKYLEEAGVSTDGLSSQGWSDVGEPVPDVVITVCDRAAGEACPLWLGPAEKVHWGLVDPSAEEGGEHAQRAAFEQTIELLQQRIRTLLADPTALTSATTLAARMRELG